MDSTDGITGAVKIRAAGDEQVIAAGEGVKVLADGFGILGVHDFEAVETGGDEAFFDEGEVMGDKAGMGEDGDASGAVDEGDGGFGGEAGAGDIGRAAGVEVAVEGIADGFDVTGFEQGAGDVGATD